MNVGGAKYQAESLEPRFYLSYAPVGPETGLSTVSAPISPAFAVGRTGDLLEAWNSGSGTTGSDIFASHVDAAGQPIGGIIQVNEIAVSTAVSPSVVFGSGGGFVVGWAAYRTNTWYVRARVFSASGIAQGGDLTLSSGYHTLSSVKVCLAPDGSIIAAWTRTGSSNSGGDLLTLQRFSSDGAPLGDAATLASASFGSLFELDIESDQSGCVGTVWTDSGSIYYGRYSLTNATIFPVVTAATAQRDEFDGFGMDDAGDALVGWDTGNGTPYAYHAQRISSAGLLSGDPILVSANATSGSVAMDPTGNFQVAISQYVSATNGYEIVTQAYSSAGALTATFHTPGSANTGAYVGALDDDSTGDFALIREESQGSNLVFYLQHFASFTTPATLGGKVWYDANANGIQDAAEQNAAATINLYNSDNILIATTTSSSGTYSFNQVMPGQSVYVQVTLPAGYFLSPLHAGGDANADSDIDPATGRSAVQVLTDSESRLNVGLGLVKGASITGSVYSDRLRDGKKDSTDPLLPGWIVYLDGNANGTRDPDEFYKVTNISGAFSFNAFPRPYAVSVEPQAGWTIPPAPIVSPASGASVATQIGVVPSAVGAAPVTSGTASIVGKGYDPAIAADAAGNYVLVTADRVGTSSGAIFGQRFSASGVALGSRFQISTSNVSYGVYSSELSIAIRPDGKFVVVWHSNAGVDARFYNADGTPIANQINILSGGFGATAASVDSNGNFQIVICRQDSGGGLTSGVQHFDANGNALDTLITAHVTDDSIYTEACASSVTGDFLMIWMARKPDGASYDIEARRFVTSGTPLGPQFLVNTNTTGREFYPTAAFNSAGDFVIAWADPSEQTLQRYHADGTPIGNEIELGSLANYGNRVLLNDDGGAFVTWTTDGGVFGSYVDPLGARTASTLVFDGSAHATVAMAMNPAGGAFVGWDASPGSITVQRYVRQPAVPAARFENAESPQRFAIRLSSDALSATALSQLVLKNADTGAIIPYLATVEPGNLLSLRFPDFAGGSLPFGSYTLSLPQAGVLDSAGHTMAGDFNYGFVWIGDTGAADALTLGKSADTTRLEMLFNAPTTGSPTFTAALTDLKQLNWSGGAGDDLLAYDFSNGTFTLPTDSTFDAGTGANQLKMIAGAGSHSATAGPTSIGYDGVVAANLQSDVIDPASGVLSLTVFQSQLFLPATPSGAGVARRNFSSIGVSSPDAVLSVPAATNISDRSLLWATSLNVVGRIDLANNDMVLHSSSSSALINGLKSGLNRGKGYWNGATGIVSSVAAADASQTLTLGVLKNDNGAGQAIYSVFDGQSVSTTDTLVKFTIAGDANLDGHVNALDFTVLSQNFNKTSALFGQGDFNYDGRVNAIDFNILATKFGTSLAPPTGGATVARASNSTPLAAPAAIQSLFGDRRIDREHSLLT